MKLEKDKIYKLFFNGGVYIVKCINEEKQYFKSLKSYSRQSNMYYDRFLKNSAEEYLIIDLSKNEVIDRNTVKHKMNKFEEFYEFEHLI